MEPYVTVFGIRYFVPVLRIRSTVLAVNVSGAVVSTALSGYLIVHDHLGWLALAAVAITGVLVHLVACPVRGLRDRGTRAAARLARRRYRRRAAFRRHSGTGLRGRDTRDAGRPARTWPTCVKCGDRVRQPPPSAALAPSTA
jgi:hypothetical protein